MDSFDRIRDEIYRCRKCGSHYGNNAVGFGKQENPLVMFIGINPWVKNHQFSDGRGIKKLKSFLEFKKFNNFFFDNIIKCQMPDPSKKPDLENGMNCFNFIRRQVVFINPKNIILFGSLPSIIFDKHDTIFKSFKIIKFPHFSSIFYTDGMKEETYYRKLQGILEDLK